MLYYLFPIPSSYWH